MKDIAIILTAHPRQQKFWAPVLLALERYPGPLILAYDDIDTAPIPAEILGRFAAITVTGYKAGVLGHGPGELVCMKKGFAAAVYLNCKYCLKLGFDNPPWRWRNLDKMRRILIDGNLDVIDCRTKAVFGISKSLQRAFADTDPAGRKGSAESFYAYYVGSCKLKRRNMPGVWFDEQLGTTHIHGEYALNVGRNPGWTWQIGELWPRDND